MERAILTLLACLLCCTLVQAYVLQLKTVPPVAGVRFEVCPVNGTPLQCINVYTDSSGEVVVNVPAGVYFVQVYPSYPYRFLFWQPSGSTQILCSKYQNPVYIRVAGPGDLEAYLQYLQAIYLNLYVSTQASTGPEILLLSNQTVLYKGRTTQLSYELQSQHVYTLELQQEYTSGDLDCRLVNVQLTGDYELLGRGNLSGYYYVRFRALDTDINVYASYACSQYYQLALAATAPWAVLCVNSACYNLSHRLVLRLPQGWYTLEVRAASAGYTFKYWNINGIYYYTRKISYYLYFDTQATAVFSRTVVPPRKPVRHCYLAVSSSVPVQFYLVLPGGELESYYTPAVLRLACNHYYTLEFPKSVDSYRLEKLELRGAATGTVNVSAGRVKLLLLGNASVYAEYTKQAAAQLYQLQLYSEPSGMRVCVLPGNYCCTAPCTLRLPQGWYYLKALPKDGWQPQYWIINGIYYFQNPVRFYLYFNSTATAVYKHELYGKCLLKVLSSPISASFTLNCSGMVYSGTTPAVLHVPCNAACTASFPPALEGYSLVSFAGENISLVAASPKTGTVTFRLQGSLAALRAVYSLVPSKLYSLVLLSSPAGARVCVLSLTTGQEYCKKTPAVLQLPQGWYVLEAPKQFQSRYFEYWNINGIYYYTSKVKFYLYYDSVATAVYANVSYPVKFYSYPVSVNVQVYSGSRLVGQCTTPCTLNLSPGNYRLVYPLHVDGYSFSSAKTYGNVRLENNTLVVNGFGEVYLAYSKPVSKAKYCLYIFTAFSTDRTIIKAANGTVVAVLLGNSRVCLPSGTYYLFTAARTFEPYTHFYFVGWKIDGQLYRQPVLRLELHSNITIYKIYNVSYLLVIHCYFYNDGPIPGLPVNVSGQVYYTNASGEVSLWIPAGSTVLISVPKKYSGATTPDSTVELRVNYPQTVNFVYFRSAPRPKPVSGPALGTLEVLAYDQYGRPATLAFFVFTPSMQLVAKIDVVDGKGILRLKPGKYLLLALLRYGNYTLSSLEGCSKQEGTNKCYFEIRPNKTTIIRAKYYYWTGRLRLELLRLTVLDAASRQPLHFRALICRIGGNCTVLQGNGTAALYLQAAPYMVTVYSQGHRAAQFFVDLLAGPASKVVYLQPLTVKRPAQLYRLYVLARPHTLVVVYSWPAGKQVAQARTNSSGMAVFRLPAGIYLVKAGNMSQVVKLQHTTGIILLPKKQQKPTKERHYSKHAHARELFAVQLCVVKDSKPVQATIRLFAGSKFIAMLRTGKNGCAEVQLVPGKYTATINGQQFSFAVTGNEKVVLHLQSPGKQFVPLLLFLLGGLLLAYALLRFVLSRRLTW
ncbi:MAG: hypothetical protein GXO42_00610 [bacterium]|nr:hypothetical protein [bacterium]